MNLWSLAQPSNFYDQLLSGVRFFDLRCGWLKSKQQWVTFHGNYGQSINKLINDIKRYLDTYKSEIVLIEAAHLDGNPTEENKQWLVNNFTSVFGNLLYPFNVEYKYPTYGEMIQTNQRVLIGLRDDIASNYTNIWPSDTFTGSYADSPNVTKMIEFNNNQVKLYNNNQTQNKSLFKLAWTLTPNAKTILSSVKPNEPKTLIELAQIANVQIYNWTKNKIEQGLNIGNIFKFDDYTTASIAQIIDLIYCN